MCRTGGRRCPSNHDAVARAARNARRRAAYAQARSAQGKDYTPRGPVSPSAGAAEGVTSSSTIIPRERLRRPDSSFGACDEDEFCLVGQRYDDKLGITISEHAGQFVERGLFSSTSFVGKPKWENLDEESHKAFGFASYSRDEAYHDSPGSGTKRFSYDQSQAWKSAKNRQKHAARHESNLGIKSYTGNSHIYKWSTNDWCSAYQQRAVGLGDDSVTQAVREFDAELEATCTGEQRIVYRGTDADRLSIPLEDVKIGTELQFDTYQSTSVSPYVAKTFAGEGGEPLLLEISTPNGVNITQKSQQKEELEVVLPRGGRYVVVGVHETTTDYHNRVPVVQLVAVNSKGELLDGTNHDDPSPL